MKLDIDSAWARIRSHAGEEFETITGKPFTYEVSGSVFRPSRTKYNISESDFVKALRLWPLEGPGQINNLVRGPAYVWAVLHDQRISRGDW